MDSLEWTADVLQHFSNCCTRFLPSLPLLRRLQSLVGTLHALLLRLQMDSRTHCIIAVLAALARRAGIQLSLAVGESPAAPLAGWLACLVDSCEETRRDEHRTCTAACTAERSIS